MKNRVHTRGVPGLTPSLQLCPSLGPGLKAPNLRVLKGGKADG
jgi:hypothetical protein